MLTFCLSLWLNTLSFDASPQLCIVQVVTLVNLTNAALIVFAYHSFRLFEQQIGESEKATQNVLSNL